MSAPRPDRRDYYAVLAECLPDDALVVTALGNASYLWAAMHDRPRNFYFEDAMGLALPFAVGLALSQSARPVVVVEGDGGLLMHMGALVTMGAVAPPNLTCLLIRNGSHAASGGQTLTRTDLDFAALARAAGVPAAANIDGPAAFRPALEQALATAGPTLLALETEPDLEAVKPAEWRHPVEIKYRFWDAIGAPRYVSTFFGGGPRRD